MGTDVAILTETKLTNRKYPKSASGYTIMCLKAVSKKQGGVRLLWKEKDSCFEVKLVSFNNGLNIVTFQLVMGDLRYHGIGVYMLRSKCAQHLSAQCDCLCAFLAIKLSVRIVSPCARIASFIARIVSPRLCTGMPK